VLLAYWCYWSIGAIGLLVLLVYWCYWSIGAIGLLVLLAYWCYWSIGFVGCRTLEMLQAAEYGRQYRGLGFRKITRLFQPIAELPDATNSSVKIPAL
jgi:hypothetical protein